MRIEDTDKERSDASLDEPILDALHWLGLTSDEDIVYQSRRLDHYTEAATRILQAGRGYCCFCTTEDLVTARQDARREKRPWHYDRRCLRLSEKELSDRLTAGDKYSVRLKIPAGETTFDDLVAGTITRRNTEI